MKHEAHCRNEGVFVVGAPCCDAAPESLTEAAAVFVDATDVAGAARAEVRLLTERLHAAREREVAVGRLVVRMRGTLARYATEAQQA